MSLGPPGRQRHVQLLPETLDAMVGVSPAARSLLAWLVLLVPPATRSLRCTLVDLAEALCVGTTGRNRHGLRELLAELEACGAVAWQPGQGGKDGTLTVRCYDAVAAQGRPSSGPWVPVYPEALDDWCSSRGLKFASRAVLLRLLLAADHRTHLVATTVTGLHHVAGVNRRRAAQLEQELCGALQCRADGYRLVIYAHVVRVGAGRGLETAPRDSGQTSREFATGPEADRAIPARPSRDSSQTSWVFGGVPRDSGQGPRDSGQGPRDSGQTPRDSGQSSRALAPPPLTCRPPYLASPAATTALGAPMGAGEGKEEASQPARHDLVARLAAQLGERGTELLALSNAGGTQVLARELARRSAAGWADDDLVGALVERLDGAGSVTAVMLSRARALPEVPLADQAAAAAATTNASKRAAQEAQADRYGDRRAGIDAVDDEALAEDLHRAYGGDAELLERAWTAAKARRPSLAALRGPDLAATA